MFTLRIACSPSAFPTALPLQLSEVESRPGRFSSLQRKLEFKGLMKMDSGPVSGYGASFRGNDGVLCAVFMVMTDTGCPRTLLLRSGDKDHLLFAAGERIGLIRAKDVFQRKARLR